ncbi:hypothetical protein HEK616_83390 (plasmid) [Streptomyces nigrescens]|uniref:Uncharacterized protein n=1 Tax=Streptomyces nigrescens TaxID=1920 RepID=A0ABM8A7X9_STRNI|nr:hypothetical protein HEK616_83390 [Streptomyces nigrescens]
MRECGPQRVDYVAEKNGSAVTTPAPTSTTVTLSCPPKEVGRCASCQQPCHRYGHGGNPLYTTCRAKVEAGRTKASATT